MKTLTAILLVLGLAACKPSEAEKRAALETVEAAAVAAERTKSSPVAHAPALLDLDDAKKRANAAGANEREISAKVIAGSTKVAMEDAAAVVRASKLRAEVAAMQAETARINVEIAERALEDFNQEAKESQRLAVEKLSRETEAIMRKHGIKPDAPPPKPSSEPGLPPGVEPAKKSVPALPPGVTKEGTP